MAALPVCKKDVSIHIEKFGVTPLQEPIHSGDR